METAVEQGFSAARPKSKSGKGKTTGYPDILLGAQEGHTVYLECKIFGENKALTTMRSFYLSPSENFKITADAHHILMAFGVERQPIQRSSESFYSVASFKIVDLAALKCDVKYEFNSDNLRLYNQRLVLADGKI